VGLPIFSGSGAKQGDHYEQREGKEGSCGQYPEKNNEGKSHLNALRADWRVPCFIFLCLFSTVNENQGQGTSNKR
jgi:hypothetical protein